MADAARISTYREFWPYYLREHADPRTRHWHIAGTGVAAALVIAALASYNFVLLIAAIIAGYGPAWITHAVLERNRPATLHYPLWSLLSDLRMTAAWLSGTLGVELEKAGLPGARQTSKAKITKAPD